LQIKTRFLQYETWCQGAGSMLEKPKSKGENSGKVLNDGAPIIFKHYQLKKLVEIVNRKEIDNLPCMKIYF